MMFWIIFFAVLAVLAAGYFFSILPATSRRQECLKFAEWNYAHRGLWNAAEGVPENSLPAFARAAEQGYAIELDIQITKDGRIVVFHDDTMKRMCGNEGKISDYTYEELQQFHLGDSTEKIPLLREVLQTVDGRVPLLIEIKMPGLCTAVCAGFQKEMEGIYTTCVVPDTLDESPMAYKSMEEIVAQIGPTAEIIERIRPVYNFKAAD